MIVWTSTHSTKVDAEKWRFLQNHKIRKYKIDRIFHFEWQKLVVKWQFWYKKIGFLNENSCFGRNKSHRISNGKQITFCDLKWIASFFNRKKTKFSELSSPMRQTQFWENYACERRSAFIAWSCSMCWIWDKCAQHVRRCVSGFVCL